MPTQTLPGAPTKQGWHLIEFANGDAAVARWNGNDWVWGSLQRPDVPLTGYQYLGSSIVDIATHMQRWNNALQNVPLKVQTSLIAVFDHGILGLKGEPVMFHADATPVGNSGKTGSEAVPTNIIPSPIDPNVGNSHLGIPSIGSIFGVFASLSFWKGIGLVLAGALILVFAALEFRKLT